MEMNHAFFVTGGTGFIGSHLVRALCKKGLKVVVLVRDGKRPHDWGLPKGDPEPIQVYGDVRDFAFLRRVLGEYEVRTVFHLAAQAQVSVANKNPLNTFETNVRGTWNLLEACRLEGVSRSVVASSDKAYGTNAVPYQEAMPLRPGGPYETSNACVDLLCETWKGTYGVTTAWTRCGNVYGPGQTNRSTLITGTILDVLEGRRPVLRSDGEHKRDFLYVEDAVRGYLALAESGFSGPYNFGTSVPQKVIDVVRLILGLMKSDLEPEIRNEAKGEIRDQFLDPRAAKIYLGWAPAYSLVAGLEETIEWCRSVAALAKS